MVVKDRIVSWFLSNVMIPRMEIIDKPGFIAMRVEDKKETNYLRELIVPEEIFIELERKIAEKYGDAGKKALYSIGKKFGYRYALISKYPSLPKSTEKQIADFVYLFNRYVESTYAKRLDHKVDVSKKYIEVYLDDYIVCSHSGIGLILTDGSIGGMWSFIVNDPSVEGIQVECQGRGDKICKFVGATPEILKEQTKNLFYETDLKNIELDPSYGSINSIRKTTFAAYSFKDLIDSGFFSFSRGIAEHNKFRHFLIEGSMIYIIEDGLKKLEGAEKVIFDVAFDFGKKTALSEKGSNFQEFNAKYMSALGWGDILITEKNKKFIIISNYFPWTEFAKDSKFLIYSGIMSGLFSGFLDKEIILRAVSKDLTQGYFSLTLMQE